MTMPNAQSAVSRAFDSPDIRQAVADLRLRLADGSRLLLGVAGAPVPASPRSPPRSQISSAPERRWWFPWTAFTWETPSSTARR